MLKIYTATPIAVIHCCSVVFFIMENYYWETELPLEKNEDTMHDFIDNHLEEYCGEEFEIIHHEGTYAEIENHEGKTFGVQASGNGDFCNHRVHFVRIS